MAEIEKSVILSQAIFTNKQAAINFNNNNPRVVETFLDNQGRIREYPPDFPDPLFSDLDITRIKLEYSGASHLDADANAFAWILEKYNTGIILLKENSNGSFKKLGTKEVNQNGTIIYTIKNCQ